MNNKAMWLPFKFRCATHNTKSTIFLDAPVLILTSIRICCTFYLYLPTSKSHLTQYLSKIPDCLSPMMYVMRLCHASVSRRHWIAWKFSLPSFHLQIAIWQQALLQLDFCDKEFYLKELVIHYRISWGKVCCPITI